MAGEDSCGAPLRVVAQETLGEAGKALSDERIPDFAAIHEFRKAIKRLRALLRLLEPNLGESARRLRLRARDLARGLGRTRDTKSAADGLRDIVKHSDRIETRDLEKMSVLLKRERQCAEATALNGQARKKLDVALRSAQRTIAGWPSEKLAGIDLAACVTDSYRRARRRLPAKWSKAADEELHDLRRRVIEHRHQMEFVAPRFRHVEHRRIAEAQKLRDRLGRCQDLVLLAELTVPGKILAPWRKKLLPLIDERRSTHVNAAERLARRLFAERPRDFRRQLRATERTKNLALS